MQQVKVQIELTLRLLKAEETPKYPGYALKRVTRKGTTYNQWFCVGPRHVSRATRAAELAQVQS